MGRLTTHVLDIASGKPAAGVVIEAYSLSSDGAASELKKVITNADGRTDEPLLTGDALTGGAYELRFHVGDYFRNRQMTKEAKPFLDIVPIRFQIDDRDGHYHVPLLVSPWAYSTYRGS